MDNEHKSTGEGKFQSFSQSNTERVALTRTVDYLVLEDDLAVFRMKRTAEFDNAHVCESHKAMLPDIEKQGFAKVSALREFLNGTARELKTLDKLHLVGKEFRERARTEGFVHAWEAEAKNSARMEPFDAFSQGGANVDDVVEPDYGGSMLFDRHGEVLPTAIYFDYLNGDMKDGAYDLTKAIKVLKADPRVRQVFAGATYDNRKFDESKWVIQEVPYYNSRPGCSQNLAFIFSPTQEDMTRLWKRMRKLNEKHPSVPTHEAVFALDLLGLRAAGAAKYDRYGMSDEYSSSAGYGEDDN